MRHGARVRDVSGRCYRSLFLVAGMAQQGSSMEAPAGSSTRPMGAGTLEGVGIPPGLQTDCETLLSRFQEMDSVRFEDFAELWRSMKFATIFWWVCLAPPGGTQPGSPTSAWVVSVGRPCALLAPSLHLHRLHPHPDVCLSTSSNLFACIESTVRNKVLTVTPGLPRTNSFSIQQPRLKIQI